MCGPSTVPDQFPELIAISAHGVGGRVRRRSGNRTRRRIEIGTVRARVRVRILISGRCPIAHRRAHTSIRSQLEVGVCEVLYMAFWYEAPGRPNVHPSSSYQQISSAT